MQKKDLQVTILSTCPVADYKTQESTLTLVSPFLKALKTKEFQEQVCCPLLEQPNIVRDLPAAGTLQFQLFTQFPLRSIPLQLIFLLNCEKLKIQLFKN